MRRFALLSAEDLTAGYGSGPDVVHGVSLEVLEHEVLAIVGSNGAGKSTFLKAVGGVLQPRAGRVRFMDEDSTGVPAHEMVARGLVVAASGRQVVPEMSVEDNLLCGAHVFRRDRERVRRLVDEAFARWPWLGAKKREATWTLSGGEQQVLVVERALMSRPRMLLLDEPTLGLAPKAVDQVAELIAQLRDRGVTVMMVEKLANLALSLSDRVAVFSLGHMTFLGTAAEAAASPVVREAYFGGSSPAP